MVRQVGEQIESWSEVGWSSDWNGYELGYDHIPVVGLYSFIGTDTYCYIDTETGTILETWEDGEDE
jgi:hypothetical protein